MTSYGGKLRGFGGPPRYGDILGGNGGPPEMGGSLGTMPENRQISYPKLNHVFGDIFKMKPRIWKQGG